MMVRQAMMGRMIALIGMEPSRGMCCFTANAAFIYFHMCLLLLFTVPADEYVVDDVC